MYAEDTKNDVHEDVETLSIDALDDVSGGKTDFYVEVSGNTSGKGLTVMIGFSRSF